MKALNRSFIVETKEINVSKVIIIMIVNCEGIYSLQILTRKSKQVNFRMTGKKNETLRNGR